MEKTFVNSRVYPSRVVLVHHDTFIVRRIYLKSEILTFVGRFPLKEHIDAGIIETRIQK